MFQIMTSLIFAEYGDKKNAFEDLVHWDADTYKSPLYSKTEPKAYLDDPPY